MKSTKDRIADAVTATAETQRGIEMGSALLTCLTAGLVVIGEALDRIEKELKELA